MFYLSLAIICSALLVIFFRIFDKLSIPVFQAIVFNYLSASAIAFVFLPDKDYILKGEVLSAAWLPFSLMLGSLFIIIFNFTSITTLRYGVSTASLSMKLGLIFPVLLAFVVYGEKVTPLKITGILMAFAAVVLTSIKEDGKGKEHHTSFAVLPFIVFLGSGLCDSLTQFANKKYVGQSGMEEFSFFLFVAAGIAGSCVFLYQLITGRSKINVKSIVGGSLLGIVNYFSFVFLLKALSTVNWGSAVVFPICNIGTIAVATLTGIVFFKEKLSLLNTIGLVCAFTSITIIIFASI